MTNAQSSFPLLALVGARRTNGPIKDVWMVVKSEIHRFGFGRGTFLSSHGMGLGRVPGKQTSSPQVTKQRKQINQKNASLFRKIPGIIPIFLKTML
jgi:hypothetical protein